MISVTDSCAAHDVPVAELGVVTGAAAGLEIVGVGTLSCADLRRVWEGTLPALFGPG